jgi:hypothetical protein
MSLKTFIYINVFVWSSIGGGIPLLWGASFLSYTSLIGNGIGGFAGIYIGYEVGKAMGFQ